MNIQCCDSQNNFLSHYTQWDTNQVLKIFGAKTSSAPVFHFFNKYSKVALVVSSSISDTAVVVKVPNILLQQDAPLIAQMYYQAKDKSAKTEYTITIPVNPKPKPVDYEYKENIDYISMEMLDIRMQALIEAISKNSTAATSAELVDLRVDHKGVTHKTAGEAIRIITGDLSAGLDDAKDNISQLQTDMNIAKSNISTLQSSMDTAKNDISTNKSNISTLQSSMKTAKNDISKLQTDVSTAKTNISALQTDVSTAETNISALQTDVAANKKYGIKRQGDKLYLTRDGAVIPGGVTIVDDTGVSFDTGYVDDDGYLHLTIGGAELDGFEPFYIGSAASGANGLVIVGSELYLSKDGEAIGEGIELPSGSAGGGYGSTMKLISLMDNNTFSIMNTVPRLDILCNWSSVDSDDGSATGDGSANWYVNDKRVAVEKVSQGDYSFNIKPYLTTGSSNSVKLSVEDAYGNVKQRTWKITVVSFELSWNLGEIESHEASEVQIRLVPTGTGEKKLYVYLDGAEFHTESIFTTGRTVTVDVPAQNHGAHKIEAWIETEVDGETVTTDKLTHIGIWTEIGNHNPVVAISSSEVSVSQFSTTSIRYMVFDPLIETATLNLYKNGDLVSQVVVDRSIQTWAYRATDVGIDVLTIECAGSNISANINVDVVSTGYDINPITSGLVLDVDPSGHSNTESAKDNFGYTDEYGTIHPFVYSPNFDWINGGFKQDADDVTAFVVKRGTYVDMDRSMFNDVATTDGKEIKIIFKTTNVRDYDAEFLSCYSGNVGLTLYAQQGVLSSGSETATIPYCEDKKVELDINIESTKESQLAVVWLSGVPSGAFNYASTDTFMQPSPKAVRIGSADCDVWIYRIKMYKNSLTRFDILDNYIADCGNIEEMIQRYKRNDIYSTNGSINIDNLIEANPDLRVLHIKAPRMTISKSDNVVCDVDLMYANGGKEYTFTAKNVIMKAQGTSSLEYGLAALNLDLDFSGDDCKWQNGNEESISSFAMNNYSIPVSYFNIKLNVASSENANNVCLADDYNNFQSYLTDARVKNNKVRDTVEGNPCAVFLTNTSGNTIEVGARTLESGHTMLYGCGDMNNSKKNTDVFGQDNTVYPKQCCIEILNNNNNQCRFISDDLSTETWDGDEETSNFEFRYPNNPETDTSEMKQAFQEMLSWVVSTDTTKATNEAFVRPIVYNDVTYSKDTAEYRAAKFVAEVSDYFIKDSLLYHYLFTEYHCMVDNRAKNTFASYEYDASIGGYRWNFCKDYDNDTAAGTDNSGGLTFKYGIEDIDAVGSQMAFNASDSVLWCNVRDYLSSELQAMYIALESNGLWDVDRILNKFNKYQSARPETLVAEDMWAKYFMPYINAGEERYIEMAQGTKEDQRRQFYTYQRPYISSKYYSSYSKNDSISLRINEVDDFDVTPYSDIYVTVKFGNAGTVRHRAKRGEIVHIPCTADTTNDLETYIYSASNIADISPLSGLYASEAEINTAVKLRSLELGSSDNGYSNTDFTKLSFGKITNLEYIDISGLPNLNTLLDLSGLTGLREFYAYNSGLTGVIFANNAPLKKVALPPVGTIVMRGLRELENFELDPSNLTSVLIEDTPTVDTLGLLKSATNIARGRLTNVDWIDDNADTILKLAKLPGYNATGGVSDKFVLTGKAHVAVITESEISSIRTAFPDLELSYDNVVETYTVIFKNYDGTIFESATQNVRKGGAAVNPVSSGMISTPTKPSTIEINYTYIGWDKKFDNVTANLEIIAIYSETPRTYTVTWWRKAGEKLASITGVAPHSNITYEGEDPTADDSGIWMGWDKSTFNVTDDLDVYAVFVIPKLPDTVATEFDYLYSDDPNDNSGYTLAEFYGIISSDSAQEYFSVGDKIKIVPDTTAFADNEFVLQVYGFNHYRLSDGTEFAPVVFGMVGLMNANYQMNSSNTNVGGWATSKMRKYLNETVYPALPIQWQTMIKTVDVLSSEGNTSATITTSEDKLFLFSQAEVGFNTTDAPYSKEVDADAESVTFGIFTDNASRIKKRYNGTGEVVNWWLRSPFSSDSTNFCGVNPNGTSGYNAASAAYGVAFGFCI